MVAPRPPPFPPPAGRVGAGRTGPEPPLMPSPAASPVASSDKGPLERLLAPIADVRHGESASALLLALLMFFLLGGYYMLKTAREVFILSEGSAEIKSYASAGQAILLLILVPAYGAFA